MTFQLLRRASLAVLLAIGVSGCMTPPRTVGADASIKTVAVVSILSDSAFIRRLGLTIFNNDARTLYVGEVFNQAATSAVESRLRSSRPGWVVKTAVSDAAIQALVGYQRRRMEAREEVPGYREALVEIARAAEVDAVMLVIEQTMENGVTGVGVTMSAMPLLPTRASARAYIGIGLMDRQGQSLIWGSSGIDDRERLDLPQLGLASDLSILDSPRVSEQVGLALRTQLEHQVTVVLKRMGY